MQKSLYSAIRHPLKTLVLVVMLGAMMSACKSYHLGSPAETPFRSLYIKPVSNHSFAPQAQAITSAMLRENFIRDARVKVVANEENADAVLFVDLTDYGRNATARSSLDTEVADVFDLRLTADVSLFDQATGLYLFENRSIQATTNAYTDNPYEEDSVIAYQLSERQAMEQLARELARRIADEVLNPW